VYCPKEKLLYELIQADMQNTHQGLHFVLLSRNVRWDGVKLGYSTIDLKISQFEGTKAITDLAAYPIKYYTSPEELKQRLRSRGEKFLSLRGIHHKAYQGIGIQHKQLYGLYNSNDPRNVSDPNQFPSDSKADLPTCSSTNELLLTPKRFTTNTQMKSPLLIF
jgi:hypothetical protein